MGFMVFMGDLAAKPQGTVKVLWVDRCLWHYRRALEGAKGISLRWCSQRKASVA